MKFWSLLIVDLTINLKKKGKKIFYRLGSVDAKIVNDFDLRRRNSLEESLYFEGGRIVKNVDLSLRMRGNKDEPGSQEIPAFSFILKKGLVWFYNVE